MKLEMLKIILNDYEQLEKKCEKEFDDACKAVNLAESEGKTTEEVNALTNIKVRQQFNLLLTALVAENTSDKRDKIMKKDLRLQNKIGEVVIIDLDNAGKVK
ncbi:unnamed protein product [Rotaria sp. Silwood2]|nr:unnamed protein product [Rotaria sp. Silwood2]CAF2524430.1 unnamed protein product [Rotaria sp. Silwood2]